MRINASTGILRPESETFNFVLWLADINHFGGRVLVLLVSRSEKCMVILYLVN